ncbi:MAG: MFS transporter [Bacteroidetes bacterium]|nr:MFS transporter [Bacteroidota bacterium]
MSASPTNTAKITPGKLHASFVICFIATAICGSVSTLMSNYLPVAVKDIVGDVSGQEYNSISALINALFLYGWMLGGIAWGVLCDRIGRAKAVIFCTAFYAIFTVLTGYASTWFWVVVCRFLSGFGVGGVLLTTNVLILEIWPAKRRTVAVGMLSISFPVGIISAGFIKYMVSGWRQAFSIGFIPLLLALVAFGLLSESGRWIESKGPKTAIDDIDKDPHYRRNLAAGSVIFGGMLIGMWAIFSWLPTWVQIISHKADAQHEIGISMMLIGLGGLSGGFVSGWVVNAMGLKRTMMLCFIACFVMVFCLFKLNNSFGGPVLPEIAILAIFFGISQGAFSVYIPQLFRTSLRAYGTGICFNVGRLFTATVVFFIGALARFFGGYGNSIFAFSFVFLLGLITTYFSREGEANHL